MNRTARLPILIAAVALLAGCASAGGGGSVAGGGAAQWRSVATDQDRERLRDWRGAWMKALSAARAGGHSADLEREGVLLQPDAALGGGSIPNGTYRCRTIKVGARSAGLLNFVSYPAFRCRIRQEQDVQGFAKLSGSQRQVGLIFPGDQLRQVFLGTLVLADERRAMQYGRDPERDIIGYVERIGPNRWRLVMPSPKFESLVDVLELVPSH